MNNIPTGEWISHTFLDYVHSFICNLRRKWFFSWIDLSVILIFLFGLIKIYVKAEGHKCQLQCREHSLISLSCWQLTIELDLEGCLVFKPSLFWLQSKDQQHCDMVSFHKECACMPSFCPLLCWAPSVNSLCWEQFHSLYAQKRYKNVPLLFMVHIHGYLPCLPLHVYLHYIEDSVIEKALHRFV